MREELIRQLTESVTRKKESHIILGRDRMQYAFDGFIDNVKYGLYYGLDEYEACYLLLSHSTSLLNLYNQTVSDANRICMLDELFEDSFLKFLNGLNSEFFNMFRIRNFEKFVIAIVSVVQYDSAVPADEYAVKELSDSFLDAEKALIGFSAGINKAIGESRWPVIAEEMASFRSSLLAHQIQPVVCEDYNLYRAELFNRHYLGAAFQIPDEPSISVQAPEFDPAPVVYWGGPQWEKDFGLYLNSLDGSTFHNRRLLVRAQREHWKKMKGGAA